MGFPCGSAGNESACNAGDLGSIPGLGRSPGEGNGYPLWYSGLENSMDHGVARSQTRLSSFQFTHFAMVCHSLFVEQRHGKAVLNFDQAEKQTDPLYTETAGQRHQEAWSQEAPRALHVWALNRP